MKYWLVIIVMILMGSAFAGADDIERKTEITIYSGLSFPGVELETEPCFFCPIPVEDRNAQFPYTGVTELGHSALIGFKVGRYLNSNMEIEGNFSVGPDHTLSSESFYYCPPGVICPLAETDLFPVYFFQENAVTYHYDGNFVYNFTTGKARPYVSVGLGGMSTDAQNDGHTDFTFNFGGGAKFYFDRFGLRFEVNDHLIPDHWLSGESEHNLQVEYGFLFGL